MKNFLLVALMTTFYIGVNAQITTPAASPAGSTYSEVGLTDITIDYSRPKVKGRQIFGEGDGFLQPFGKLWRSGANAGTIITTSTDIKVEGQDLPAGKYMLLTIPGKDSWTVIFYKDISIGGNMAAYKEEDNQLKVMVKSAMLAENVEALTFNISDFNEDNTKAAIQLTWANTSVKIGIEVNFDEVVMADIAAKTSVNERNYLAAANYYLDNDKDLTQALKWMDLYLANHSDQFWNIHLKARIQAKMGDKKGAKATANQSLELAKASERGDFGYIKLNEDLIKSL